MTQWVEERSAHKPDELQIIAEGLYMQRKDIEMVVHEATEEQTAYTEYVCKCREITESEYNMLKGIEEIDAQKAIDDYTLQLMEEGVL